MVKFMNLMPGKEKNMMKKIRCRDELEEMRGREKRGRGVSLFYFFRVMVEPVLQFILVQSVSGI
jgi:hypothetical protein